MSEEERPRQRRINPSLLVLLLLLLLLCLCMVSPSLAKAGGPLALLDSITHYSKPVICRVPQLAAVALFCPDGERGGYCDQSCDPQKKGSCGNFEDVSCQKNADGRYTCGGPGCTQITQGGGCFQPCNPDTANACAPGLKCVPSANTAAAAQYVCMGTQCQPTGGQTGGQTGGGTETAGQNCKCEDTDYVCRNPDGSVASASYNTDRCGGANICQCRGTTWVCPDGTYATFNPNCGVGGSSTCTCVQNPNYPSSSRDQYICKETGAACKPTTTP